MAISFLDRVATALFGSARPAGAAPDDDLLAEIPELVVDTVEPKIRYRSRYKQRLRASMTATVRHLQSLARDRFEPITLSKAAWSTEPHVNAFFATAEDVRMCLGNSTELRQFFEQNAAVNEAYA